MAEIIDFKVEKKRILKKWEAEIEVDIKAQDWYIEAKRKLDFEIKKIWRIEKWRITKYISH